LIGIGLSGLRAAQAGLTTTGQNIANINTPGFSRQQVVQTASVAQFTGAGYLGTGTNVSSVRRIYSDYLTTSLQNSTASSASATSYSAETSQVDGYLADSSSSLSSASDTFFAAVQTVATNPSDSASRQTLLSTARTLAARFNDLNGRLIAQGGDVDRQIDDSVSSINTLAQQVATLNKSILTDGRDATNNQIPNDLLDQRDALVQQIAGLVGSTSIPQSDGTLNVFVGNGQPLVVGGNANTLSTVPDDQDATKKQLAVTVNGQPQRVATAQVTNGTIGGLFRFRDQILSPTLNSLGQTAIGLGTALNAQNALGQDAAGNPGAALFTLGSPLVAGRLTNSANAAIAVTVSDATQLTTSDYRLDYDGTNYKLTDITNNTSQSFSSLPQTVDGINIAVTGALAAGDRFTISPTRNGARDFAVATTDPSKIATAAPIALSAASTNTGAAQLTSLAVTAGSSWPANLQTPVNVKFHVSGSTTTYDLIDPSTNAVLSSGNAYTSGTTISQNGWNLTLTGSPADSDTFTVGPNTGGSGDPRNALLLAAVQQANVTKIGSSQDTYNGLVGLIGNKTQEATSLSTSEDNLLTQAQTARDSVSGVNLDEEAVNLQKYQQAYQAASKSIATAQAMFQSILALFT
jgi:flagellar hook-associated protein 1 FlgK